LLAEGLGNSFIKKIMGKILLAIDSQNLDENAIHFAAYLTRVTQSN
jgi:hypothetical protein